MVQQYNPLFSLYIVYVKVCFKFAAKMFEILNILLKKFKLLNFPKCVRFVITSSYLILIFKF